MASWSHYSHGLDMVSARRLARSRRKQMPVIAYPGPDWSDLIDLEFSDYGRDGGFAAGWFLAPVMLTLLLLIPLAL